jgi:cell division protein FtsN
MNKASPAPQGQNFKVQVGSSRSKEEANTIAARLTKAGLAPGVEMADLKEKGIWYRIRLQGYKSREVAEETGKKLLSTKLISQYWVVLSK